MTEFTRGLVQLISCLYIQFQRICAFKLLVTLLTVSSANLEYVYLDFLMWSVICCIISSIWCHTPPGSDRRRKVFCLLLSGDFFVNSSLFLHHELLYCVLYCFTLPSSGLGCQSLSTRFLCCCFIFILLPRFCDNILTWLYQSRYIFQSLFTILLFILSAFLSHSITVMHVLIAYFLQDCSLRCSIYELKM